VNCPLSISFKLYSGEGINPLFYCCVLGCVYWAVSLQCFEQFRHNINNINFKCLRTKIWRKCMDLRKIKTGQFRIMHTGWKHTWHRQWFVITVKLFHTILHLENCVGVDASRRIIFVLKWILRKCFVGFWNWFSWTKIDFSCRFLWTWSYPFGSTKGRDFFNIRTTSASPSFYSIGCI
jgi:hypothetical protein